VLILPASQPQKQQVMTSQITSHIDYLILIYCILVLIFSRNLYCKKSSHNGGFLYDLMKLGDSGLLFWATLYFAQFLR